MFWWDPMYLVFTLPPLLLALIAQAWIKAAYSKGLRVITPQRVTGLQGANTLLRYAGVPLRIEVIGGRLSDHYDPRSKTLRLSHEVASSPSVGALAIVAHEVGHALQDYEGYALLQIRSALVAPVNIGTQLGSVLFIVGFFISYFAGLAGIGRFVSWLGVAGFCLAAVFALVTLPVELDASRRGLRLLRESGLVMAEQMRYARSVLTAAAWTYIAALAQALAQVLYYVYLLSGDRRRRR